MRKNSVIPSTSVHTSPAHFPEETPYDAFYPPLPDEYVTPEAPKRRLVNLLTVEDERQSKPICILQGPAGAGKTSLAVSLVYDDRIQDTYDDGVYWVDVGPNPYDLVFQLNEIGADVSGDWIEEALLENLLPRFHAAFADRSALVIFDDVVEIQHALQFRPPGQSYRALFTTRNELIAEALKAPHVSLTGVAPEVAEIILGIRCSESADTLARIAQRLDFNPLALQVAGRLCELGLALEPFITDFDEDDPGEALCRLLAHYCELMTPRDATKISSMRVFPSRTPIPLQAIRTLWTKLTGAGNDDLLGELGALGLIQTRRFSTSLVLSDLLTQDLDLPGESEPEALHHALLQAYNPLDAPWWTVPDDGYIYRFLLHHLIESEQPEHLTGLLLEYAWIKAKVEAAGPVALYEDYNFVYENKTLRVVQEAIRLSSPILTRDPGQIGSQLIGRLQELDIPAMRDLVQSIRMTPPDTDVWLDPYCVHLNVPDSALIKTYKGHRDVIHAIAIDADNNRIVSGSADHTLRVWDLVTGEHLNTLEGHEDAVQRLSLTRDSRRVISCADDRTIKVWNLERKTAPITHFFHQSKILALQALPDNRTALSSDDDGRFLLWEIENGAIRMDISIPDHRIWSIAVDPAGHRAFTAGDENFIRVWDLDRGVCQHVLTAHEDWVWCLKVTPDGRHLVSGSEDGSIVVWDLQFLIATRVLKGHHEAVRTLDMSQDGRVLVSTSEDQSMIEWNFNKGVIERSFTGHEDWVWDIAVTPEGHAVFTASDDASLKLWSLAGHTRKHQNRSHEKGVRALTVTPDNEGIVSASDDASLIRWRIDSGQFDTVFKAHKDWIWDLRITADGRQAVSASFDHNVVVWDLEENRRKFLLEGHEDWVWALSLSNDDRFVFSGSEDATIRIWDVESGRHVRTLRGHKGGITTLMADDDNRHIISASQDRTIRVWRISDGAQVHVFEGHTGPVNALVLCPLDQRVASGSDDGTIRLWNYQAGSESDVLTGHEGSVKHLVLTGLGTQLISASDDLSLRIWDIALATEDRAMYGHWKEIRDIAVSRDGRLAASVSDDHSIFLWHLQTGELLASFYADYPITRCAFTIDDQRIVAGDAGGGVHFLRVDEMLLFT